MPWYHCDVDIADDLARCPACGAAKLDWTAVRGGTRVLRLSGTWIELELRDDAGEPVGAEPYVVELRDGTLREGALDVNGFARLEAIPPGVCVVRFPRRQGDDVVRLPARQPELQRGSAWVELELVDAAGVPVAGEPFQVLNLVGEVLREGQLDGEGRACVERLPAGRVVVAFPGRDAEAVERDGPPRAPAPVRGRDPAATAWLEVELAHEDGAPAGGEPFCVETRQGEVLHQGALSGEGRARVEGLPAGPLVVSFPRRAAGDVEEGRGT